MKSLKWKKKSNRSFIYLFAAFLFICSCPCIIFHFFLPPNNNFFSNATYFAPETLWRTYTCSFLSFFLRIFTCIKHQTWNWVLYSVAFGNWKYTFVQYVGYCSRKSIKRLCISDRQIKIPRYGVDLGNLILTVIKMQKFRNVILSCIMFQYFFFW